MRSFQIGATKMLRSPCYCYYCYEWLDFHCHCQGADDGLQHKENHTLGIEKNIWKFIQKNSYENGIESNFLPLLNTL